MSDIPYRTLGSTGEKVSLAGLGGAHIGMLENEQESIRIIRTAIDNGITFMDNAWDYHDGVSEIRMGKALRDGYRDKVFLMTKVDGQSRKAAVKQLDESLSRLQTDTIDLLQFHEIIRMDDPDYILAPGSALDAIIEAQKAGKVRYIGFTGHKSPDIHLKMLQAAEDRGFTFDAVQMPLSIMDPHTNSFEKKVLPVLEKNGIAALAMKTLCSSFLLEAGIATKEECLHYAMSLPVSVVITGCKTVEELEQTLEAARNFKPISAELRSDLLRRSAREAQSGELEPWKAPGLTRYDATDKNPEWIDRDGSDVT